MDISRQEYPALLASLQPNQAVSVLNDRVRVIGKINSDIADWLQERRRVEDLYVQGLRKLARRPQQDGGSPLGIFQMPWQRIITSTESLAQSHEILAAKIETDVERPLREFVSKNREMQSMSTIQGNLAAIAKDFDNAQKKAEKLKDKGPKAAADKVANVNSSVDDANQQWESQAPYVFEQLQAVDESRLNHLRDVLTQFQTHEVDQVERNRLTAEGCLNTLLNVETADEIKAFAARISGGRQNASRRRSSAAASGSATLPPPLGAHYDGGSQRSGTSGGQGRLPPTLAPVQEQPQQMRSGLGGLKRLGTVMGRRKSMIPPGALESPQKEKKSRSSFAPFRRGDSSRSFQQVESSPATGRDLTPVTSQDETIASRSVESPLRRPQTNQSNAPADVDAIEPVPAPFTSSEAPTTNGITANSNAYQPQELAVASSPIHDPHATNQIQTDAGGLSSPPSAVDDITRAEQEAAAENHDVPQLQIRDQPIPEDEGQAQQAMNTVASRLRMQAQQSGFSRNQGTLRGRRDVRNTVFVPAPETNESPVTTSSAGIMSPPQSMTTPGTGLEDRATFDTTSIHSSHTLSSLTGAIVHPELHEPGLNASIIETVSSWFSEGTVTRSFVVGELAMAYNTPSAADGFNPTNETIRLENFGVLEKVAANPTFVTPTSPSSEKGKEPASGEDKSGEYAVSLSAITRSIPTVAFKYQLHLDESNMSAYSPVIFAPSWQLEANQASIIIFYSLNPQFASSAPLTSLTLKNVIITVSLDHSPSADADPSLGPTRATNAMMSPTAGGSFKRKRGLVVWRIPELTITPEPKKFLARFITTGGSGPKKGKVEAKWDLTGEGGSGLGMSVLTEGKGKEVDPFADEGAAGGVGSMKSWREVAFVKKLGAGKYVAA